MLAILVSAFPDITWEIIRDTVMGAASREAPDAIRCRRQRPGPAHRSGGRSSPCRLAGTARPPHCRGATAWRSSTASWRGPAPARVGARGPTAAGSFTSASRSRPPGGPSAIAVVAGPDPRLTYRELDESANRLARYLAGLGEARRPWSACTWSAASTLIRSHPRHHEGGRRLPAARPGAPAGAAGPDLLQVRPAVVITTGGPARIRRGEAARPGDVAAGLADSPAAPRRAGARSPPVPYLRPGQPLLRHLHLGVHRRPQGGRGQLRQPGLRHR